MKTIYIIFLGLVSFARSNQGVDVFLADTVGPQQASDGCPVPTHDSFVVAFSSDVAQGCADEAGLNIPGSYLLPLCSWSLRKEQVTFEGHVPPKAVTGPICNSATDECPVDIPNFKLGIFSLKNSCRDTKPADCPLTGRIALPVERIRSISTCGRIAFRPIRGPIAEPDTRIPGDIAWTSLSTFSETLTLHIRKFGSITGDRTIVIKPQGAASVIGIANIVRNHHSAQSPACLADVDHHFEMYYQLAEMNSSARRPVPSGVCPRCSWLKGFLKFLGLDPHWLICPLGLNERIICPMSSF
jgi:hypothetical protein